jgi:predicted AAA+ superfamily ATPase
MNQEIFQALLEWNPWLEEDFPVSLLGIQRNYHILSYLKIEEIKILVGARRVGKSTLLYQVIKAGLNDNKRVLYINFQDEVLSKYTLSEIYYCFLEKSGIDYLVLDEVQNCKEWVHFVRKMYDGKKLEQIWISGSNSKLIKKDYAEILTGRNLTISIAPLSFAEFLSFHHFAFTALPLSLEKQAHVKSLFSEFLKYGAFPAVVLRESYKIELLQNYYEDFIYKDIASRYDVKASKIKDLGIYLASNISKTFSYRNISQFLNINQQTVSDYISYLQEVYLFDIIHRFDYSLKTQHSYDKKAYIVDVGLAGAISFSFSQNQGRILENIVFSELKRRKHEIYYHKEKKECDFIVKRDLEIISAIQVCSNLSLEETKQREVEGLIEAMDQYNLQEGLILTLEEENQLTIEKHGKTFKIIIQPVWKWLLAT